MLVGLIIQRSGVQIPLPLQIETMFSDNHTSTCDACYNFTLAECSTATEISITGTGLANGTYDWFVQDKFGAVYKGSATAASGTIAIPLSGFPEKYFNRFAGVFTIWFEQSNVNKPVTYGTVEYSCIKIDFTSVTPAPATLVIS